MGKIDKNMFIVVLLGFYTSTFHYKVPNLQSFWVRFIRRCRFFTNFFITFNLADKTNQKHKMLTFILSILPVKLAQQINLMFNYIKLISHCLNSY
jgi:hypothetical protein